MKTFLYFIKILLVLLSWFLISLIGFLSGAVIIAHILKHKFGVKGLWLQNDTEDGDFGADWWIRKVNNTRNRVNLWGLITVKKGLWSAFCWWFRNHSWNFIELFSQPNTADREKVIVHYANYNLNRGHYLKWAHHKEGVYGWNFIKYTAEGIYCIRFSYANSWFTFQIGSGGDRYKCLMIPVLPVLILIGFIIVWILI